MKLTAGAQDKKSKTSRHKKMTTKLFKNGNSQAVRIPADLAFIRNDIELEIERVGQEIHIRPLRRSLAGVMSTFAKFSADFMREGRGEQSQTDREKL
jgi:antitoxin VapB